MSNSIRTFLIALASLALLGLGAQVHADVHDVQCNGCVGTTDIAAKAVTTGKIALGAVATARIANGAVTTGKIAPGAVATARIANKAVTTGKIAPGAVTTGKIAPGAVATARIANGAVTLDKLAPAVLNSLRSGDVNFRGVFVGGRTEGRRQVVGAVAFDTSECSRWLSFAEDLRGGNFTTITLSGSEGGPFTCTDPVAANLIADALNSGANTSTVCDGSSWNTQGFDGIGQRLTLDGSLSSCDVGPSVRPCIGNLNWGGLGALSCNAPSQSIDLIFQR